MSSNSGLNKPSVPLKKFVKLYEQHGSIKAVARALNKSYVGVHAAYEMAVAEGLMDPTRPGRKTTEHLVKAAKGQLKAKANEQVPIIEGKLRARETHAFTLKKKGITRFLFSSVQNNTVLFEAFWKNLLVLKAHYDAQLCISRFAYIKSGLGSRGDKRDWMHGGNNKVEQHKYFDAKMLWWDERTEPFWIDDRYDIAPGLVFCGELNILPTKQRPLSGYEVYTGRKSGIFPHVKIAMESIATVNSIEPTKFNYTTGTVTMRNYIQRDAGLKAEFHHCYGALLVEVNQDGEWWCRQINADSEGTIYDKDLRVKKGKLTTGHRVEAITMGDIHEQNIDKEAYEATWGVGGMVDVLRPKHQFIHDLIDFESRSHHGIKSPHNMYLLHRSGRESVYHEMMGSAVFLAETYRPWCQTHVVDSNHDRHPERWLEEQNALHDPVNASYWLELQSLVYGYMNEHGKKPNLLELALTNIDSELEHRIDFIPENGSFIICHDRSGGIECGMHGDRAPNGARGNIRAFARMGRKANVGHSHTAGIYDGVYQTGTKSKLKLSYNNGPSSWSHTDIVTYANGKRALYTIWRGKAWA